VPEERERERWAPKIQVHGEDIINVASELESVFRMLTLLIVLKCE
jgi:hypothetical protein